MADIKKVEHSLQQALSAIYGTTPDMFQISIATFTGTPPNYQVNITGEHAAKSKLLEITSQQDVDFRADLLRLLMGTVGGYEQKPADFRQTSFYVEGDLDALRDTNINRASVIRMGAQHEHIWQWLWNGLKEKHGSRFSLLDSIDSPISAFSIGAIKAYNPDSPPSTADQPSSQGDVPIPSLLANPTLLLTVRHEDTNAASSLWETVRTMLGYTPSLLIDQREEVFEPGETDERTLTIPLIPSDPNQVLTPQNVDKVLAESYAKLFDLVRRSM